MPNNKYYKKSIYIKPHDLEVYEYLNSKGRHCTDYIVQLVRLDMENGIPNIQEMDRALKQLMSMNIYDYVGDNKVEAKPLKEYIHQEEEKPKIDLKSINML